MAERERIGVITQGSLAEGLTARLDGMASVENMRVGNFVVVQGQQKDFFCLVSDVRLESTNDQVLMDPPGDDEAFARQVLAGTSIFGTVQLAPSLMLERELASGENLRPVKTVPSHFSPAFIANEEDFQLVFGIEEGTFFQIGRPLDMEVPVCINLEKFVERSNGIFGKSGTGKSFLARLLLAGVIKTDTAVNLIFDMHNEYAWETEDEQQHRHVKGLRQLFGARVSVFSLDPEAARRQGVSVDYGIKIGLNQMEPGDILLLQDELKFSATAGTQADLLYGVYKEEWINALLAMKDEDIKAFVNEHGGNDAAIGSLQSRLRQIANLDFVTPHAEASAVREMLDVLDQGRHVVLQFGRHDRLLEYILVTNILTRRIHEHYKNKTDRYRQTKDEKDRPRQLVITIEEAHQFLSPQVAAQTIFGTIAREMRKYHVTLMIIDQRPSGIDSDILSQIGTRVTAALNDEKDIDAVFTGMSGARHLKAMLANLDPKQQALVMGYAVPMSVVVRTRSYDEQFYKDIGSDAALSKQERREKSKADIIQLFGE